MALQGTLLYRLALSTYKLGARFAAIWNLKAAKWVLGQQLAKKELGQLHIQGKSIWVHCASLGEYEQARPVIDALKQQYPLHQMVITFYSPSGYEVVKPKLQDDTVLYLPLDSSGNAKTFLDAVHPSRAIFIKYENWYFYLSELKARNIPALSVSAIFRPSQPFFKWYGGIFREMLKKYTLLLVQDDASLQLLQSIGIQSASVNGDTRFDRVWDIREKQDNLPIMEQFKGGGKLLICGSTWPPDNEMLIRFINKHHTSFPDWKFVIAPHQIDLEYMGKMAAQLTPPSVTYSHAERNPSAKVMFIDSIGFLSRSYRYADVAYIGGGFGVGIHNTLEAAANDLPVVFGPKYQNFKEAVEMVQIGAAFPVKNLAETEDKLATLMNDNEAGKIAGQYVQQHTGATARVLTAVKNLVPSL